MREDKLKDTHHDITVMGKDMLIMFTTIIIRVLKFFPSLEEAFFWDFDTQMRNMLHIRIEN